MKKNLQIFDSITVLGRIGNRVYQRTAPGQGNVLSDPSRTLQNRAYVPHTTSNTPAQQVRRNSFKAAALSWKTQTPEVQADYNTRANARGLTGYNLWISTQMRGA